MGENSTEDIRLLKEVGAEAGEIAMKYFRSDNEVWMKSGNSPVSRADMEVNKFLHRQLRAARPDYGWLSEETDDNNDRLDQKSVFVVDPIDGTRGFINGSDRWCIAIAVVEEGRPTTAILECPALKESYSAIAGKSTALNGELLKLAQREQIRHLTGSQKILDLVTSSTSLDFEVTSYVPSLAYRIAMVAAGKIDLAIARSGAHDWDLAAADLVLTSAGGQLTDLNGGQLRYNRKELRHQALIGYPGNLREDAIKLAKSSGILH